MWWCLVVVQRNGYGVAGGAVVDEGEQRCLFMLRGEEEEETVMR